MHAFLLVNRNPEEFAKEQGAKVIPFTLQKIEDTRDLKKLVKFSFSEKTAIIIENIDTATVEASNAFLKNLEEPTKNIIYILTASNMNNVLPTITSRCEIVKVLSTKRLHHSVGKVLSKPQNYKDALNIKDRGEAIEFIENLVYFDHQNGKFENMENYLNTLKNLKLNGNVGLQLTNLVVRMNSDG